MGSAVSCGGSSSAASSPNEKPLKNGKDKDSNNKTEKEQQHQQKISDEVSEDPALQSMLEHFQLADKAVELHNYPKAMKIITEAEQYLSKLSQTHLKEAHLHAMAIFQRRGTYRRMMNQLKEAIEEYEFGLEIGEAKVQKRGTSSQYLLLHLICEISCLMASCHMGLLVGCKRILLMRKVKEEQQQQMQEEQHQQMILNGVAPPPQILGPDNILPPPAANNNNNNNSTNQDRRPSATPSAQSEQHHASGGRKNNNNNNNPPSRPPSQLAMLHTDGSGIYSQSNASAAGAVSFSGRMTPPGQESSRGVRGEKRDINSTTTGVTSKPTTSGGFLSAPGGGGGLFSSAEQKRKQVVAFKVEDEDILGADANSFSFAQSMAANIDIMVGNDSLGQNNNNYNSGGSNGGGSGQSSSLGFHNSQYGHGGLAGGMSSGTVTFEKLAAEDPIMGPMLSLPTPALEVQENLHSKAAEQSLLHCVELVEELQNRSSELLLGPLFRLADLYETLEMMEPCERCVRRLVGISLVKYGHDHDIYLRQNHRLNSIATRKEERKTLKAAVMISKTWKMKVQMKRLRAANARQSFEPRRHIRAERMGPPPSEDTAKEVLEQVVEMGEDPPSEYEESEDDEPNFDDDYENYDENDLIVPAWDEKGGANGAKGAATAADLKRMGGGKKDEKSDDAFKALRD